LTRTSVYNGGGSVKTQASPLGEGRGAAVFRLVPTWEVEMRRREAWREMVGIVAAEKKSMASQEKGLYLHFHRNRAAPRSED
jgi:hypothetical protein